MHTAMLRYRPEEHCVHVSRSGPASFFNLVSSLFLTDEGPLTSGGGMCLERNYTDTVMSSPYADNFLAPVANMPDDPDVDKLPEETQKELAKVSLSLKLNHSTAALKHVAFRSSCSVSLPQPSSVSPPELAALCS